LDLEHLYEEWEEKDEDKLPPDELEPHKRPPPKLDSKLYNTAQTDPRLLMSLAKKGKTVMTFVNVAGNPTRERTEELTNRWQTGLRNNHVRVERFIIEDDRAMFVFEDGSQAYEYKDFLLSQPELSEYVIDGQSFHGKGYPVEYPNQNKSKSTKDVTGGKGEKVAGITETSSAKNEHDEL